MSVNTCICCQKSFTESAVSGSTFGVCPSCTNWKNSHMSEIQSHRAKMVKSFSPAVEAEFNRMPAIEQGFVVLRSMELKLQANKLLS